MAKLAFVERFSLRLLKELRRAEERMEREIEEVARRRGLGVVDLREVLKGPFRSHIPLYYVGRAVLLGENRNPVEADYELMEEVIRMHGGRNEVLELEERLWEERLRRREGAEIAPEGPCGSAIFYDTYYAAHWEGTGAGGGLLQVWLMVAAYEPVLVLERTYDENGDRVRDQLILEDGDLRIDVLEEAPVADGIVRRDVLVRIGRDLVPMLPMEELGLRCSLYYRDGRLLRGVEMVEASLLEAREGELQDDEEPQDEGIARE
ncbi:MAG: hypothetical protein QXP81_09035 [Nitrososphaerota archaeon]